jgi:hypothetical protein
MNSQLYNTFVVAVHRGKTQQRADQ